MRRVAFTLKVKPDLIDEYRRRHADVWPEMLDALRETGWKNYSIFLQPDGTLLFYVETPDFKAALAGMAEKDVNRRWQEGTILGNVFFLVGRRSMRHRKGRHR